MDGQRMGRGMDKQMIDRQVRITQHEPDNQQQAQTHISNLTFQSKKTENQKSGTKEKQGERTGDVE